LDELFRGNRKRSVCSINHADGSNPIFFGEFGDGELSIFFFVDDRRVRDDCQTEADFDRAFYRFDVVELGDFADIDSVGFENFIGCLARRDVALEEDEIASFEFRNFYLFPFGSAECSAKIICRTRKSSRN
jgi:hypothetical protein